MYDLEFWSDDRRFGLKILSRQVSQILRLCVDSNMTEVGGILVGFYTTGHDCAIVNNVSAAPLDSRCGITWFRRGVRGLQRWLDRLWYRNRYYYLGEWHFHPYRLPVPSSTDIRQMKKIAESILYKCPQPVLLIIGGDPLQEWVAKAFVFPRREDPIELAITKGRAPLLHSA